MIDLVLKWIGLAASFLCFGCLGFAALWYVVLGVVWLVEKWQEGLRRREFAAVEAFRTERGETVILREGLEERLKRIGPFTMESGSGTREIRWESPPGLVSGFAPVSLVFVLEPDNVAPDETAFRLLERFVERSDAHFRDFRERLIELHRSLEPGCQNEALKHVDGIQITLHQEGYGEGATHSLRADFELELDPDHGHFLVYDPDADRFGDWDDD